MNGPARGPVLLFGAAGQVGQALLALCHARKVECVGVTRADADIASPDAVAGVLAKTLPRFVVNAAAYTAVDRAEAEPDLADLVNAHGAANVARAAAELSLPVLHLSTDYVFDGTKQGAYREDDPVAPLGVYGRSKARGEAMVRAANEKAVVLRTAWVYGQYGSNFLKTMVRLAGTQDALRVVADQHGCPTHTTDIAEAILAVDDVLRRGRYAPGVYHFTGEGVTTWHGLAQVIVDCQSKWTHRQPPVHAIMTADYPTPARRPVNSELDSRLFERTFGYRAKPWQIRTRETVDILMAGQFAAREEGADS